MEIIKSNDDISSLFSSGIRSSNHFVSFMIAGSSEEDEYEQHDRPGRVAFIAGKKNGNAVWRNAAKRRMREIYRTLEGDWKKYDLLFIARSSILNASYSKVLNACDKTLNEFEIKEKEM